MAEKITRIHGRVRFIHRRDTAEKWKTANPVLAAGEHGVVTDSATPHEREKIGDGVTPWNDLGWWHGPKGENGRDAVTDISYNPQSENAQSGKAVAEAVATIPKGDKGDPGESGVYVGTEEPDDEDTVVWVDPDGEADVLSVAVTPTSGGNLVSITDPNGTKSFEVLDGEKGDPGANGHTPEKGVDYWTEEDKSEIIQSVVDSIKVEYPEAHIIYGDVDSENNIVIYGELADGTYILKYENEDGSTTEIGELIIGSPTIVNQIPLSIDTDGNLYNGGQGWKTGYRVNSSGAEVEASGMECTGFIPAEYGDTIYMKNIAMLQNESGDVSSRRVVAYDANFAILDYYQPYDTYENITELVINDSSFCNITDITVANTAYIRIVSDEITNDSIVTINAPIV